jgi:hypothetical protein
MRLKILHLKKTFKEYTKGEGRSQRRRRELKEKKS